jgi:hypothetical protein
MRKLFLSFGPDVTGNDLPIKMDSGRRHRTQMVN